MKRNTIHPPSLTCLLPLLALLTIACVPRAITMPTVVGRTEDEAKAIVGALGLTFGGAVEHYSDDVPPGRIISQNPEAATPVRPGTTVYVAVSKGPAPSLMPDVLGLKRQAAINAIQLADLQVSAISQIYHQSVAADIVLNQYPAPGAPIDRFTIVNLTVSLGPRPQEPVVGFTAYPRIGPAPLTVQFTDLSDPGDSTITAYEWFLSGNRFSIEQNPKHTYPFEGTYPVTLTLRIEGRDEPLKAQDTITVTASNGGDYEISPGEMVPVPGGWFEMGDPFAGGYANERPVHDVYLSPYEIGKTEVTNGQFAAILNWAWSKGYITTANDRWVHTGNLPILHFTNGATAINFDGYQFSVPDRDGVSLVDHPVTGVTWYGANAYCIWLNRYLGLDRGRQTPRDSLDLTQNGYHLPTEAQWERAASWDGCRHQRMGTADLYLDCASANFGLTGPGCNPAVPDTQPYTAPVGDYAETPSPVGCLNMSGNVSEWCEDIYNADAYEQPDQINPLVTAGGLSHIHRGGSWQSPESDCRTARRHSERPYEGSTRIGFRIARYGGDPYLPPEGEGDNEAEGEGSTCEGESAPPLNY